MKITPNLFEAYVKCPTKCWLRATNEPSTGAPYPEWVKAQNDSYRVNGTRRLVAEFPNDEVAPSPDMKNFKVAKWRLTSNLAVKAQMDCCTLESELHALERVPAGGRDKPAQFIPIRFVFTNKLDEDDKLVLAFDAFALSRSLGFEIGLGKIIHGDDHVVLKVKTSALTNEVQKCLESITILLSKSSPPDLVLNRHCTECDFRPRCRALAIEKDDLSLLESMTEKERRKLHSNGIFTVTQLSYTFRPRKRSRRSANKERHHHSLRALGIREKRIHIVSSPDLKLKGTAVYLDVEGLPDRDFYYLIGARVRCGTLVQQYSLWAENTDEEEEIWNRFLSILATVEHPVLIHYGSYEGTFLKRMCERYGGPAADSIVDQTLKSPVNLLSFFFCKIYLPTYSNGLKDIAAFFGATWRSPNITGIQTIALRCEWERTRSASLKESLLAYNQDDCAALELLRLEMEKLIAESESRPDVDFAYTPKKVATECGSGIHRTLDGLLKIAWLDYSRNKIKFRKSGADTSNTPTIPTARQKLKRRKLSTRGGQVIRVPRKRKCPRHPEHPTMLRPSRKDREHAILDIVFTKTGCRKTIVRYRGKQSYCPYCGSKYPPPQVKEVRKRCYGEEFHAWVAYLRVTLRLSLRLVAKFTRDLFHEEISLPTIEAFFKQTADSHEVTEELLLRRILQSPAIHVDETKISIRGIHQQVWGITNGRDVVFRLTETQETGFLQELLNGYQGVLVSDFYGGYDAITCRQQKCLVHLIRDLNDDLWKNPFNAEYERFVAAIRDLLVPIVGDIERYGLNLHLRKHRKRVDCFYRDFIDVLSGQQEILLKYRKRFERYRNSMFTFLNEDEIPWNNNAAERALRHLAVQRKISGDFSEKGARRYLRLLAIAQTCRFQNKSFLGFLLSGLKNVDQYEWKGRRCNLCDGSVEIDLSHEIELEAD
jgi:predicted RecB family nuclease